MKTTCTRCGIVTRNWYIESGSPAAGTEVKVCAQCARRLGYVKRR